MIANGAFLAGLIAVPALLLWLGHHLRDRSRAQRRAFWGGVIGHSIAMVVALIALHYPAVLWSSEPRIVAALWSMLLGGVAGAIIGGVMGRR